MISTPTPIIRLQSPERKCLKCLLFKGSFSAGLLKWQGAASTSVVKKANTQKRSLLLSRGEPGIRPCSMDWLPFTLPRCLVSNLCGKLVLEGDRWNSGKLGERQVTDTIFVQFPQCIGKLKWTSPASGQERTALFSLCIVLSGFRSPKYNCSS